MQKNNYAPLIEFHGFVHPEFAALKEKLKLALERILSEEDYKNLTFSETPAKVMDTQEQSRPFIRMFSSEYVVVHKVVDILKEFSWKGEVEFIKITNYFDLRA